MKGAKYLRIFSTSLLIVISIILTYDYGASTTFQGMWRYPAEEKQYVVMTDSTAYFRDVLVEARTHVAGATDGDTWTASITRADGSTFDWNAVTFYSNYNGKSNCFVYPGLNEVCNITSTKIYWSINTQCRQNGNYQMSFYYNKNTNPAPVATTQFTLLPQIKDGKVPAYNQAAYLDAYDHICHHPDNNSLTIPCSTPGAVPYTIKRKGCFLTSAAMILSYHGVTVDPPTLNTWLKNYKKSDNITSAGFDRKGNVQTTAVIAYAAEKGVNMAYDLSEPTTGWSGYSSLDRYLCTYGPHIIKPSGNPGHWVTATGRNSERTTVKIIDPSGGVATTLQQRYNNNNYIQLRTFSGPEFTLEGRSGLTFRLHSPGELLITDSLGRRIGYDPNSGIRYNEIPNSYYDYLYPDDDTEPYPTELLEHEYKELYIGRPVAGDFKLQVIGTGTGNYELDISSWNPDVSNSLGTKIFDNVPITPNEVHIYGFNYSKLTTDLDFSALDGNFDGKGQRPTDVNKFLSYVTPTSSPVTLAQGKTSYTLVIVYDKNIKAETFTAALNGNDVTSLFRPKAGRAEAVTLNLNQGRNTLVLSVDGTLPSRMATDTDRLVFIVP
ncbi:C39 family peptidase [Candidatus Magnetominusculus xianensis]|uniref:Peptidase C39-like domain-containing protein n=1 Tax=Candidatus Magnetominusculus xianensis TaxID=1748249 RepID=A0ABR5SC08_9BACT|nr:C39 family peptidase [Candidatus Magnetominusculus xianensis]KWT78418.1 hypothetical protein ASN18_2826 [Candidatus Magnetominusculus xianensis]MBF0403155.1 C39 family peptidase [Nitrospirota bacterium]